MKLRYPFLLLLGSSLLSGCDSSYHAYDGSSGYKFSAVNHDRFQLEYYGNAINNAADVEQMWHHKARELCRGGAYQHSYDSQSALVQSNRLYMSGAIVPKAGTHHVIKGQLLCLAPNLADKDGNASSAAGIAIHH